MRIAFVTQWFPPEPATVPAGIATGLAGRGHQVEVLTGFPNYPTGRLAPGYRVRPYQREEYAPGVTVHRAPLYPSHDTSAVRRMANYASFAAAAAAVALARIPASDVWLSYSSPATAALPALLGSRVRGSVPHYQLVQDLWPDSVLDSGMVAPGRAGAVLGAGLRWYCDQAYRRSTGLGVISPGMRAVLRARGIDDARIHDTPNWAAAPEPLPPVDATGRAALGLPAGRLFLYAGNLGELQALEQLVRSFAAAIQDSDRTAHLVLIGDGVARARLTEQAARLPGRPVLVLPAQPPERIGAYLAAADVLVVSLADTPLLRVTMPSKVQSSLAAGRAVLAHAAGDAAEVVRGSGAGLAASPADPDAVRAAVRELADCPADQLERYGQAARACYQAHYTPQAGLDRLEAMLTSAPHARPAGPDRPGVNTR